MSFTLGEILGKAISTPVSADTGAQPADTDTVPVDCASGKVPYRTRAAAKAALKAYRHAPAQRRNKVYQCDYCLYFHWGHRRA